MESGCELGSIIKLINKKKYTIGAIAGAHGISIGGAVTNNVHGKDSKFFGAFLNNIIEIKVLLTDGKEKIIKKKDIPKILNFGLFYIITEVKLKLLKIKSDKIFGDGKAGIKIAKVLEKIKIQSTQKKLCYH